MMKRFLVLAASALLPNLLPAQGIVVPVPCNGPRCAPPPCPNGRACPTGPANVVHEASSARVVLDNGVLKFAISESLRNTGGQNGEVDYMFPLPKMAAFQDLAMTINGEMMAGEVLPADRARTIYESIVRVNRDPALVEWMGHGLLRTRIFPITPGELKQVEVRLQAVARREGDAIRVDYFVGTRRGQATGPNGTPISFSFTYPDSAKYGAPYSPTHAITSSTASRGSRTVSLSGTGTEVTLLLPIRSARAAAISVVPHADLNDAGFALITLAPPTLPPRATPRDVVFVIDVSGSMAGTKMDQAKAAGRQLLATLRPEDRFRIVHFSTDVSSFEPEFVLASRENINRANAYLTALEPLGSTNISAALDEALRSFRTPDNNRLPLVLFLTDGAPTIGEIRPEAIAQRAADRRGRARVFTFGVGTDVKAELIEALAVEGRGTAQMVSINESVERAVSIVASRLTAPIVTDLRLRSEGVRLDRIHPTETTDLFAGQDVVVLARYNGSGRATIHFEGNSADGPVRWSQTVDLPTRELGNSFVSRLWATQRVGFLSAERRKNGPNPEVDNEIRALGERYSIPTMFTSYMVIEPGVQIGPDGRVINANDVANGFMRREAASGGAAAAGTAGGTARGGGGGRGGAAVGAAPPVAQQGQQGQAQTQSATGSIGQGQLTLNGVVTTTLAEPASGASAARKTSGNPSVAEALSGKVAGLQIRALTAHEEVRLSQSQRDVRSDADLDKATGNARAKRVGDRVFNFVDSTWIDARFRDSLTVTKIKPFSEGYFELLKSVPSLKDAFALGSRVLVAGRSAAIFLDEKGLEKLTPAELAALVKNW